MLKLFWTPAQQGGVPADAAWQASADALAADLSTNPPLQRFTRGAAALPVIDEALAARLDAWLTVRSHAAPLTILVHGYDYDPRLSAGSGADSPFSTLYGVPGPGIPAQLSLLPLVGECNELGHAPANVAIAFAWLSEETMSAFSGACWNNDYQLAALDLAPLAARALATVIGLLAARQAPVRILAHSLGTRVTGLAIGLLRAEGRPLSIERVVLLGGAEFCVDAAATYAGCDFDVINLVNRKDLVLAVGGQQACHPVRENGSPQACVIGRNGLGANARWIDLQLDADAVAPWFAAGQAPTGIGYDIQPEAVDNVHPTASLNHWAYYTNPGNRPLVRDLLQHPAMAVGPLLAAGIPNGVDAPMYSHFNGLPIPPTPATRAERRPDDTPLG